VRSAQARGSSWLSVPALATSAVLLVSEASIFIGYIATPGGLDRRVVAKMSISIALFALALTVNIVVFVGCRIWRILLGLEVVALFVVIILDLSNSAQLQSWRDGATIVIILFCLQMLRRASLAG
jgi:hypothetical protein